MIYDTPLHENGRPNLQLTNNLITYAESIAKGHDILISHWKEDHHQDHADEHPLVHGIGTDASVPHDSNGVAGRD